MIITKGISFKSLMKWTAGHIIWLLALIAFFAALYHFKIIDFRIPWLPVSVYTFALPFLLSKDESAKWC